MEALVLGGELILAQSPNHFLAPASGHDTIHRTKQ